MPDRERAGVGSDRRPAGAAVAGLLALIVAAPAVAAPGLAPSHAAAEAAERTAPRTRNLVFVTVDGLRIDELFGGADAAIVDDIKAAGYYDDSDRVRLRETYVRPTPEARRRLTMPFFWGTLAPQGIVLGNKARGGSVHPKNPYLYTTPGFAEIVTGRVWPEETGAGPGPFPHRTFLDFIAAEMGLRRHEVGVFGPWEGLGRFASSRAGAFFVNSGYERVPDAVATPRMRVLNDLQFQIMAAYDEGRSDAVTFGLALEYFKARRPRILWVSLGETDDWGHTRRYDRYLDYLRVLDGYLRDLWTAVEASPSHRGRTSLVMTTDHGRGRAPADWVEHGTETPGSEDAWIAVIGPDTPDVGDAAPHPTFHLANVAATAIDLLGLDAARFDPEAAPPVPLARRRPIQ